MSKNLSFDPYSKTLTVSESDKIDYFVDGKLVVGDLTVTDSVTVTARPKQGYSFPDKATTSWTFPSNEDEEDTPMTFENDMTIVPHYFNND